MNREFLKGLGLEKDAIDKVMAENGKDIEAAKQSGETAKNELETVRSQLDEANKQIEGFKELDVDGIKKAAEDYKTKFEAETKQHKADMEKLQFDHALAGALSEAKAKNTKAVSALLELEGLKLKDGTIIGLEDQLKKLKSENDYLFDSDEPTPKIVAPTGGGDPMTDDSAIRAVMGLPVKQ